MHSGHARRCGRARGHRPHGARGGGAACSELAGGACAQRARKRSRTSAASFTTLRLPLGIGRRAASVAFDHYIYTGTTRLRCGYTTGSCGRARGEGGLRDALVTKARRPRVDRHPRRAAVEANVVDACIGEGCAQCAVRKDAGDDADVTDGVLVYARVEHAGSGTGAAAARACPRANRKFPSMAAWAWGA